MNYQSDYKSVPLLPSDNIRAAPEVCCRHRRLSRWAIIISVLSLAHTFYLRYSYSHHVKHQAEPYAISAMEPTSGQLVALDNNNIDDNSLSSFYPWCPLPSDTWETVTTEFQVPSVTYQGLNIEQNSKGYINFQSGAANVLVDENVDETTVRFDVSFYNPYDRDLVEFRSEEKPNGTLSLSFDVKHPVSKRICLKLDVTVTISSPSILENLSIQLSNSHIIVHGEQAPVFSDLILRSSNGHIETTEAVISNGNIILTSSNGSIKTRGLIGNNVQVSSSNGNVDIGIDSLTGNFSGTSSNGKVKLNATTISGEANKVELSSSNGHVVAHLPDTFESLFDVSTSLGKAKVQSGTYPEKIHYSGSHKGRHINGYYGDAEKKTNNVVKASSLLGHSLVVFG